MTRGRIALDVWFAVTLFGVGLITADHFAAAVIFFALAGVYAGCAVYAILGPRS